MKLKLTTNINARYWSLLAGTILLSVLTACGGGNGGAGTPIGGSGSGSGSGSGTGTTTPVLTLSAVAPSSQPFALAAYGSTTITVQVNASGAAYKTKPVVVNFTSTCATAGTATLAATATSTTNNGQASVTYTDKGCGATDTVTASIAGGGSVNVNLNVAQPAVASISVVSVLPTSIVFSGTGVASGTATSVLTFKVVDSHGNPVGGVNVAFTNNNNGLAVLGQTSTLSETGTGLATTSVTAVGQTNGTYPSPGAIAITATAKVTATSSQSVSVTSNNVLVSTGLPSVMTMSANFYNLEGIDFNFNTVPITVSLIDSNGNVAPNGTVVAASTNEGGIVNSNGSSSSGGCTITNSLGQCGLIFSTQNPKFDVDATTGLTEYGIATVTATSGGLSSAIKIYMSGSFPNVYYSDPTGTQPWTYEPNGSTLYGSASCPSSIVLLLSDEVGNPLAKGTTFAMVGVSGITIGTLSSATMPDDGDTAIGPQDALVSANVGNISSVTNQFGGNVNTYIHPYGISVPITVSGCTGAGNPLASTGQTTATFTLTISNTSSTTTVVQTFHYQYGS